MQKTDLCCVGSIVVDLLFLGLDHPPRPGELKISEQLEIHPGGCATNTSIAFAKLGGKARLIGRVGADSNGAFVIDEVERSGVCTDSVLVTPVESTAVTAVMVSTNGERTFCYYPGCNALLTQKDIDPGIFSFSRIVHFADVCLFPKLNGKALRFLLQKAKETGLITSMDTSWDETGRWLTLLRDCLPFVDFFFCNIIEAQTMTGFSELNDISQALLDCGPETVVVKLGEHGSFIKRSELSLKVPTFPVQVVDTTGAGDCFVAAFLFGYLKGWDYERIARFANATGAICVTMPGATTAVQPATDIEGFLAKLKGT